MASRSDSSFPAYIEAVISRFGFLLAEGYDRPRISVRDRECAIVYWGRNKPIIAIYHDMGGPPYVEVVPLDYLRGDGSVRSYGLAEAMPILTPVHDGPPELSERWYHRLSAICPWLDWYAAFLQTHVQAIIHPSCEFLDAIERRRI